MPHRRPLLGATIEGSRYLADPLRKTPSIDVQLVWYNSGSLYDRVRHCFFTIIFRYGRGNDHDVHITQS